MITDTLDDPALRHRVELALANHGDDHLATLTVRDIRALLQHAADGAEKAVDDAYKEGYDDATKECGDFTYDEADLDAAYERGLKDGRAEVYDAHDCPNGDE